MICKTIKNNLSEKFCWIPKPFSQVFLFMFFELYRISCYKNMLKYKALSRAPSQNHYKLVIF